MPNNTPLYRQINRHAELAVGLKPDAMAAISRHRHPAGF